MPRVVRLALSASALLAAALSVVPPRALPGAAAQDAAQDTASVAAASHAAARDAHATYETVLRDPPPAPRDGPDASYHEAVRRWQARLGDAERAFVARFRATRWEDWTAGDDTVLLERGLLFVGREAFASADGDTAIRAFELLIEKLPRVRTRLSFPVRELPLAYVLAGRIADGRRRTEELLDIAPTMYVPRLLVTLGNYECLQGDLASARAFYRRADAAVSEELRNCCGAEAAAARDAVIKLRTLDVAQGVPSPEWGVGTPAGVDWRVCVVAFADIYRSWDATEVTRLGRTLADSPTPGVVGLVATPAQPRATPSVEGRPARDPRYVGRAAPDYPAPDRAEELRRNLGLSLTVIGVADDALPCDLWTGDYDVVFAPGKGAVYVRGPADDRVILHALLRRLAEPR